MDKQNLTHIAKEKMINTGNSDREIPDILTRGKNLGKAVVKHIINKCEFVEIEEYERRINICNTCDLRNGRICTHPECGCYLDEKGWWLSEHCPLNKWVQN